MSAYDGRVLLVGIATEVGRDWVSQSCRQVATGPSPLPERSLARVVLVLMGNSNWILLVTRLRMIVRLATSFRVNLHSRALLRTVR